MKKGIVALLAVIALIVCAVAGWFLYQNSVTIMALTAELEGAQTSLAETQLELENTVGRLHEALAALEEAQTSLAESQLEVEDTKGRLDEALANLEEAQVRIEELEKQIEELEEQIAAQSAIQASTPVVSVPANPTQSTAPSYAGGSTDDDLLNPKNPPTGPRAPLTPEFSISAGDNIPDLGGSGELPGGEGNGGWNYIG